MKKIFQKIKVNLDQEGFTLIELMVALTLFTIVVMAAVSSLYTVNNAARKVEAMRGLLDNLNFAMESMSRTIRTGQNITTPTECTFSQHYDLPCEELSLTSTLGVTTEVEYRWWFNAANNGEIQKRFMDNGTWSNWVSLTAPEINIQKLSFYVDGNQAADGEQPEVVIMVQGVATTENDIAPFAIQTFISARAAE